ncbi:MAG: N-acetyltransferase [Acidobacteria bacterium]|nr:N-acetyltransferase [Acidobacteriota bacterium]
MVFYGKYTFQSTNATGPQMFLTSSSRLGQTYPVVSAPSATEIERWIVYQNADETLTIQMGDLFYLSAIESVGWVIGDTSIDQAYSMKTIDQGGGQVALQIYSTGQSQWLPVRYSVNVLLPYLVFPIAGELEVLGSDTFYNFTQTTITPSLAAIQSSKNAQSCDFQNVDLSQADLSGVNCTGADFTNANLDGTIFSGATLTNAIFVGASLDKTNFSGATLDGAFFTGTDVSNVIWGTAISARGTHFDNTTGISCKIGSANPNLHADFTKADFTGADFSKSDFSYAYLIEATLIQSVFVGAIFQGVDFTSAQLGGLDKTAAATLSYTYMPNVIFSKANLFGVSFAFATVFGAATQMSDAATIEQADFSNAYLEGIDLTAAALQGAKFNNACLVGANLTKAQLSPTLQGSITSSLIGACLQGVNFTQSDLTNADLSNATVAFSQGTINVRYCDPLVNGPFPPPPDYEPLNYSATQGLDLTTMSAKTVCPNELTVAANQAQGNSLQQMLTTANPKQEWVPVGCSSSKSEETVDELDSPPHKSSVVIETPNLFLHTFSLRHFRDLRRLADDPEVKRYLFWNQQFTDRQLKAMIHYWRVQHKKNGITRWPVYRKSDKAFVGMCGFSQSLDAGGVEVSLGIMPEFRGDPITKELYRAVLNHGFSCLGLDRIYGLAQPENIAIKRFESKFGFRFLRQILVKGTMLYDLSEITPGDLASSD